MKEIIMAFMGELSLKGQNRKSFEATLLKNLRKRTADLGEWRVHASQSTIYLEPKDDAAVSCTQRVYERCKRVFGIATLSRAACCEKSLKDISDTVSAYLAQDIKSAATFKVKAKRADKTFELNSMELSREVGAFVLGQSPHLKVDVHTPQLTIMVEVREQGAYVHSAKQQGAGGLPIPSSGRAALLLSGGIDSPVAAWLMAKRGLALVPIHFASPPYTSPRASAKVERLAEILSGWCGPLPYHHVLYTKVQEYIRDTLPRQEYFTVLMRRSMLRIAAMICEKERCEAIITGESLAQVASQTMAAIACTNAAVPLPILRPCIGMDKIEITSIARRIDTFETSILPYEDCCTIFTPAHPKTKPRLEDILRFEAAMPQLAQLEQETAQATEFRLIMPE